MAVTRLDKVFLFNDHLNRSVYIYKECPNSLCAQLSSVFAPALAESRDTLQAHDGETVLDSGPEFKGGV
jgi:hypothetical protein